jgi:hypothetical protein
MAASDGQVGLFPDGTGKAIDVSELTRVSGVVVERQRVSIGDFDDPQQAIAQVRGQVEKAGLVVYDRNTELLKSIDERLENIAMLLMMAIGK